MAKAVICPVCGGAGRIPDPGPAPYSSAVPSRISCYGCGGKGWVVVPEEVKET